MAEGNGNNINNNNNNGDYDDLPELVEPEERGETSITWTLPINQVDFRFTRMSRDTIVWLPGNDARAQNDRNRIYEQLRAGGNDRGPERLERSWQRRVERQRNYVYDEVTRRVRDMRGQEDGIETRMARCPTPSTEKTEEPKK